MEPYHVPCFHCPASKRAHVLDTSYKHLFANLADGFTLNDAMDRTKQFLISQGLKQSGGNITRAASMLGISRGSLRHYMRRLNVSKGSN